MAWADRRGMRAVAGRALDARAHGRARDPQKVRERLLGGAHRDFIVGELCAQYQIAGMVLQELLVKLHRFIRVRVERERAAELESHFSIARPKLERLAQPTRGLLGAHRVPEVLPGLGQQDGVGGLLGHGALEERHHLRASALSIQAVGLVEEWRGRRLVAVGIARHFVSALDFIVFGGCCPDSGRISDGSGSSRNYFRIYEFRHVTCFDACPGVSRRHGKVGTEVGTRSR